MKHTKRSLLTSAICLLLTAVMLMGSTFAWFTDSVTNEGNQIQSGTLDISLNNGDETTLFSSDNFLFEPGRSQTADLAINNEGSLWLKYTMSFANVKTTGNADITEVLDVYKAAVNAASLEGAEHLGTMKELVTAGKLEEAGVLAPKGYTGTDGKSGEAFTLVIKMQESAGNQYQNCGVTFDVTVSAAQYNKETDGFGNPDYDKDAGYRMEVDNAEAFLNAIETLRPDQTLTLTEDITFDGVLPASAGGVTNIDLNGHTLTASKTDSEAIVVGEGQTLNISNGNLTLKRDKDRGKRMPAFSVKEDAVLNLSGVDYTCDGVAISVSGNALAVNVVNSKISASSYALQTISDSGDRLVINLTGSEFKVAPDSAGGATGTMILVDSPVRFNMLDCQVESAFHSVILRGAQAVIENSRLVNTVEGDSLLHFFDNRNWGSENMVNLAAITLGNKGDGFQYPTTCTMINTQVVSEGVYPAIYAYGNTGEGLGVTLQYTDCTITGDIVKGNDAVVVNP